MSGGGGRRMPGPVSNEDTEAGSGIGCVRALSLVPCLRACVGAGVCGVAVALSRLCGYVGYPGGGPPQIQDVWVRLLQVVEGAEEASLAAWHVLLREMGVVSGRGVWAGRQQCYDAGCHHVRAEL